MSRIRIAPIVEGQAEDDCIPVLLRRIWSEIVGGEYVRVERPGRHPGGLMRSRDGLQEAVRKGLNKLAIPCELPAAPLILILIDADDQCPAQLGPEPLQWAREVDHRVDMACAVIKAEYETWFVASAGSLVDYLDLNEGEAVPDDPEEPGCKTHWIEQRFRDRQGRRESKKTRDQPRMTARMDLALCRRRSSSFDKLCRELELRARAGGQIIQGSSE